MQQVQMQLKSLREHPAQMRTRMDVEEMARLTLQVHERGLDAHQPVVVAANGDGTFRVVSGHRRWLAVLLAHEVRARLDGKKKATVDLDFVYRVVLDCASAQPTEVAVCALCGAVLEGGESAEGWCPTCENWTEVQVEQRSIVSPSALMGLYGPLSERYGEDKIPVVLFEGGEKEEILALQAANFGQETPDLLGQARSYAAAVQAGATAAEIAANTGQSAARVEAVLALSDAPQELAQAIVAGDIALGIAAEVARLRKKAQREGITRYVLERETCTVEEVHDVVSALRKWQPPAVSLDPEMTPRERNHARLLAALWADAEKRDPTRAWRAAAWAIVTCSMRLEHLDVQGDERELLYQSAPEARCENCQLRDLLRAAPPFRYPHYACQQAENPGPCFDGVFGQDPFYAQVPFGWEEYPGVQRVRNTPACLSAEDLQQAVQAAARAAEDESETASPPVAPGACGTGNAVSKPSDVADQRTLIRSYMEQHAQMSGARHPLATRCEICRYRLDGSPTKDPGVPPCQWAARRRWVEFLVRAPADGSGPEIPLCRQFAPVPTWNDLLPAHPSPPGMPREWMAATIEAMTGAVEERAYGSESRMVCEFLTGRTLKAGESHKGWFLEKLRAEVGNLSDGQLWTLVTWVTADWMRHSGRRRQYLLPLPDGRVLCYADRTWRVQPPPEPGPVGVEREDETAEEA
ncbi:MAG: ParB N-terminal domain-containing protein [Anaerolineae bacterium]|nr:ParB N-terminal domain-containing protein [Anaerolineae bacterium]